MQSNPRFIRTKKLIALVAFLTSLCPLIAGDDSKRVDDPFSGAFFPPEFVLLAHDQITLTPEQLKSLSACVEKSQPRFDGLRIKLEHETDTLSALAKQEHVDEAALNVQLDRVLDVERELKHLQVELLVAVRNLLTPEQQIKLREIGKDGFEQLQEDTRKRLSEKVERVRSGVQKWVESGRDPSAIARTMEEKVKPLIDAGKIIDAEAELDRLLVQLEQEPK